MRNATLKKTFSLWLLASAAFPLVAPNALALSDGRMAPAVESDGIVDTAQDDLQINQAFEGTTRPGLALEGESQQQAPADQDAEGETPATDSAPIGTAAAKPAEPVNAEIIRDLSTLPEPVKQLRERMVEAAASGDIDRLRPLIEGTLKPPQIMNGESDDPIETLKNFSGDPDGQEILAIMLDILATGAAHLDKGTPEEAYVWPYFTGKPLASLTPPERVELLRIVTAGDLMGMEETGNYNFYRIGIAPDGQWKFMNGGD